jgi:hypothetical protein
MVHLIDRRTPTLEGFAMGKWFNSSSPLAMKMPLLSWNVGGMMIPSRMQIVRGVLQRIKLDVIFLQEVKSVVLSFIIE